MPVKIKHEHAAMVATIVVIEFISGFTQGFYEPLIPKFGEAMGVDASGLQLFNVIPTAIAALFVPVLTRLGDHRWRNRGRGCCRREYRASCGSLSLSMISGYPMAPIG